MVINLYSDRFAQVDTYFGGADLYRTDAVLAPQKVLKEGQLLILQNGTYYDLQGRVR